MRARQRFGVTALALTALVLLAGGGRAVAAPITFRYTAQVVSATGTPLGFTLDAGDIVTGSFSWDTSAVPFASGFVTEYRLPAPPASFVLNLTDENTGLPHTLSAPNPGGVVVNLQSTGSAAALVVGPADSTFTNLQVSVDNGPATNFDLLILLANTSQDVLGGTTLPSSLGVGNFPTFHVVIGAAGPNGPIEFTAVIEDITAESVPEPSSFALLALGGVALAGWRRWKGRRAR